MTQRQELLIENLITELSLELAEVKADRAQRENLDARLERIERALAIPLTYNRREACQRLGIGYSTSYTRTDLLPAPDERGRFLVSEVEAMASQRAKRRKSA